MRNNKYIQNPVKGMKIKLKFPFSYINIKTPGNCVKGTIIEVIDSESVRFTAKINGVHLGTFFFTKGERGFPFIKCK